MPTADDYGGRDQNKRQNYPGRENTWARMSPAPFINRRLPGRDWTDEFPTWTLEPAPNNEQQSIAAAVQDALSLEVIRAGRNIARGDFDRRAFGEALSNATGEHPFPDGVEHPSLYDLLASLSASQPVPIPGGQRLMIDNVRLPLDLEYWRDWLSRRGPIVGMIWAEAAFRQEGRVDPRTLDNPRDKSARPLAIVVSGFRYQFRPEHSRNLAVHEYIIRPAFPVGGESGDPRSIIVPGAQAERDFIEGFGLSASIVP